jgi:hypothetical protein
MDAAYTLRGRLELAWTPRPALKAIWRVLLS